MMSKGDTYAAITATASSVPAKVLTNHDLSLVVETSDEWIRTRTGIGERHAVVDGEYTSTFCINVARQLLEQSGLAAEQIDLIIVATCTPDYPLPATASLVQDAIGASRAAAFDLAAACSGFVYALTTGTQFITSGAYKNVIVIGAETLTRFLDWQDRSTCVIFGDGAGGVLLQASKQESGILSFILASQGNCADMIIIPGGGSRRPPSSESLAEGQHFIKMKGNKVFELAVRVMSNEVRVVLDRVGLALSDVDLFVPHQANIRIIDAVARQLELPIEKFFHNIEHYGNTSAASIPIALAEVVEKGLVKPGGIICMGAFGGGLTSGCLVLRWNPTVVR